MTSENYRKYLVECIKTGDQMVIDMAEDIAGNTDCITNLSISLDFDQYNYKSIPEITISRSHIPDYEKLGTLLNLQNKYSKEN